MTLGGNASEQLRSIIERVERLESDKADIASDIRHVFAEAKGNGYDVKALREIVRRRKQDAAARVEFEAVLETYLHALGMLADTPLGQAAIKSAGSQIDLSERTNIPAALRRA